VPIVDEPLVVEDHSIYTAADLDVVPPILLSRDLSSWRQSRQPYVDLVEVMVSQDGDVERIRLVSEPRRMIDMMALSAAKMWRFDPALKDGEPVRYRLVLASPSAIYQR
jgi:TonB family protein